MKILIRKSNPDDVFGIRRVIRDTWLETYPNKKEGITLNDIRSKFKDDSTPEGIKKIEEKKKKYEDKNTNIWVAEEYGKIIGFCNAANEGEKNRVRVIYILPTFQGRGIGSLLIEKALSWLGNDKDVFVNVASYNKQAIGFYKKYGFIETGKKGVLDKASKLPSGKTIPEIELIKKLTKD